MNKLKIIRKSKIRPREDRVETRLLPEELAKVDSLAKSNLMSRSAFLRDCVMRRVEELESE